MKLPGDGRGPARNGADRARGRRRRDRLLLHQPRARHLDLQKLLEDVSNTLGAWTYLLVGAFAFAETGAFVGLVVPGETVMLLGGAVAGQGAIDIYLLIAIAWFAAWAGDTTSFFIGRRLGRELRPAQRAAGRDQQRALRKGRGLLRPPRRQDDLHRPLHQPGARLRALHRRQLGDALPRLRPLQHPRHRALGERPHPGRLLLLAQHRHAPPSTPAKAPSCSATAIVVIVAIVVLVRNFRSRRTGGRRCAGWRTHVATRWMVGLTRRFRPQLRLPLGPGHPGRHLRARVHDADGDARGRRLRPHRLHRDRRRRPGPDPGRRQPRSTSSKASRPAGSSTWRRSSPRSARPRSSCPLALVCARPAGLAPALGRARGAGRGDADDRGRAHELKDAIDRPASRRAAWSTPRAPPSPAPTPPTRPSTSGWR